MKNYLLLILLLTNTILFAQTTSILPITGPTNLEKNVKYLSQSGKHYLLFQNDGNLAVMTAANQKVWGLNEVYRNFNQIKSFQLQDDGNLVAKNASSGFLWCPLSTNAFSRGAQLIINQAGVLQLVAPGNKILWASDGNLTNSEFIPDYGWASYRLLNDPKIIIMGSRAVTPKALDAIANVYTEITKRLTTNYPKNRFDGYIIYVTNGEPWTELKNLKPIGTMWRDQTGTMSGDFLRGGTFANYLWIDEQMICKTGVRTRNEAFAAGLLPEGDNIVRTFDQVVHEFGHAIDSKFSLRNRIEAFYAGGWSPKEQFPWTIQHYVGTPSGNLPPKEEELMKEIFTEKITFSCINYK